MKNRKDNNIINGNHIRLKGITEQGIDDRAKDYNKFGKDKYFKMFEDLAKGKKIGYILNPFNPEENRQKVLFEFKEGKVSTRKEFIREIQF